MPQDKTSYVQFNCSYLYILSIWLSICQFRRSPLSPIFTSNVALQGFTGSSNDIMSL